LGIKGYKQFQLSLIVFYAAESKEFKKNKASNAQLKATICAYRMYTPIKSTERHITMEHCLSTSRRFTMRWRPRCAVRAVKRDQEYNDICGWWHGGSPYEQVGETSFHRGAGCLYYL